jgi:hypothetical protein
MRGRDLDRSFHVSRGLRPSAGALTMGSCIPIHGGGDQRLPADRRSGQSPRVGSHLGTGGACRVVSGDFERSVRCSCVEGQAGRRGGRGGAAGGTGRGPAADGMLFGDRRCGSPPDACDGASAVAFRLALPPQAGKKATERGRESRDRGAGGRRRRPAGIYRDRLRCANAGAGVAATRPGTLLRAGKRADDAFDLRRVLLPEAATAAVAAPPDLPDRAAVRVVMPPECSLVDLIRSDCLRASGGRRSGHPLAGLVACSIARDDRPGCPCGRAGRCGAQTLGPSYVAAAPVEVGNCRPGRQGRRAVALRPQPVAGAGPGRLPPRGQCVPPGPRVLLSATAPDRFPGPLIHLQRRAPAQYRLRWRPVIPCRRLSDPEAHETAPARLLPRLSTPAPALERAATRTVGAPAPTFSAMRASAMSVRRIAARAVVIGSEPVSAASRARHVRLAGVGARGHALPPLARPNVASNCAPLHSPPVPPSVRRASCAAAVHAPVRRAIRAPAMLDPPIAARAPAQRPPAATSPRQLVHGRVDEALRKHRPAHAGPNARPVPWGVIGASPAHPCPGREARARAPASGHPDWTTFLAPAPIRCRKRRPVTCPRNTERARKVIR